MSLLPLFITVILASVIGLFTQVRWRSWSLLVASIFFIYWLQPGLPIRHLDFWLPTACLSLVIYSWLLTHPKESPFTRSDLVTGLVISLVMLLIGSTRYIDALCCLTPTPPPTLPLVTVAVISIALIAFLLYLIKPGNNYWIYGFSFLILIIFIILKAEPASKLVSMTLRSINNQSVSLASGLDIRWLGFSYIAFRLLHTLRDRISGKLPGLPLQEYLIYVIFFPSITAGPIDRIQRFVEDLHQPAKLSLEMAIQGGRRILLGIFFKFVLADSLAIIALNDANSMQVNSAGWLWVMLYAFALRIFFDFSGYTDIAIGLGNLLGIRLPENFDKPYFKPNLTLFWNSWHITLASWFRAYFFNPLTRALRSRPANLPLPSIIFIGQLSTFLLIGLWHGITWNFAIWGAWHGVGLFVHNRWSDLARSKGLFFESPPLVKKFVTITGTLLTFHYVTLGWVWFVLSTPEQSWRTFLKLFSIG